MDILKADCPSWLLEALEKAAAAPPSNTSNSSSPLDGVPKGQRNDAVFKYAARLHAKGCHPEEIKVLATRKAINCTPPLGEAEVATIISSALKYTKYPQGVPKGIDGADLLNMELTPPEWIIPDVLPIGLTILAGKPKSYKSYLVLDIATSTARGGKIFEKLDVPQGVAIYLALEDVPYRLRSRMKQLIGDDALPPHSLQLHTEWPQNGMDQLYALCEKSPNLKILIIDTLGRFRQTAKANSDLYGKDYNDIAQLKKLADHFGIAVIVVHHTRKAKSEDPFEMLSGTNGLVGAADTIWILDKQAGDAANLHIRGRDVVEQTLNMAFHSGHWKIYGTYDIPPTFLEAKIIELLTNKVLGPKEVAQLLQDDLAYISKTMQRMVSKGFLSKEAYGKYSALASKL